MKNEKLFDHLLSFYPEFEKQKRATCSQTTKKPGHSRTKISSTFFFLRALVMA